MSSLHEEKPPVSAQPTSLFIDLVFWNPKDDNPRPLQLSLLDHALGERSQTVFWINKITTRLAMWKGQYWYYLTPDQWQVAAKDVAGFLREVAQHYAVSRIDYDTRAFAVGLQSKARHERRTIDDISQAQPAHGRPVWWTLHGPFQP